MPLRLKKFFPLLAVVAIVLAWPRIKSFLTVSSGFEINAADFSGSRRFSIVKVNFFQVDANGGQLRMTAARVEKGDDGLFRLAQIVGRKSDRNGDTRLRAANGIYDEKKGILTLKGGVEMLTPDGFTATSEVVIYNRRRDILSSPMPVLLVGDKGRISGESFAYRPADGVMTVTGRVRCTIDSGVI